MTGCEYFKHVGKDVENLALISDRLQRLTLTDYPTNMKQVQAQKLTEQQAAIKNRISIAQMIITFIGEEKSEDVAQVLTLKYLQGKSSEEIAQHMQIPTTTVNSKLHTAFNVWDTTKWETS